MDFQDHKLDQCVENVSHLQKEDDLFVALSEDFARWFRYFFGTEPLSEAALTMAVVAFQLGYAARDMEMAQDYAAVERSREDDDDGA